MKIDVRVPGWIISLATFVLGALVPSIYTSLTYDGISIQQLPTYIRSVHGDPGQDKVDFSTLLKVANVNKEGIIIEGLAVSRIPVPGFSFKFLRTEFKFFARDETVALPPSHPIIILQPGGSATTNIPESVKPVSEDFPPLIVKSDEDKLLGVTIYFSCPEQVNDQKGDAVHAFYNYIVEHRLPIRFRINGKRRDFKLQLLPLPQQGPASASSSAIAPA